MFTSKETIKIQPDPVWQSGDIPMSWFEGLLEASEKAQEELSKNNIPETGQITQLFGYIESARSILKK